MNCHQRKNDENLVDTCYVPNQMLERKLGVLIFLFLQKFNTVFKKITRQKIQPAFHFVETEFCTCFSFNFFNKKKFSQKKYTGDILF